MDLTAAYGYRLDWIVSFVAVARHGGFSAAAKASFRAQSRLGGVEPGQRVPDHQPQTLLSLVKHGLGTGVTNALAVATANLDAIRAVPPPTWPVAPA